MPVAPGARRGALFGVCLTLALAASCTRQAPRPPILLITVHGLRADVVGALGGKPGLTPAFDAFASAADLRVRAVAPASAGGPALASIFTGLRPWQTQVLYDGLPLSRRFASLPGVLGEAGYRTAAFSEDQALRRGGGFIPGFDVSHAQTLRVRAEVGRRLCGPEPGFLWAHLDLVSAGHRRHDDYLDRISAANPAPTALPQKVTRADLERWSDPATPASPAERDGAWALYQSAVADADAQMGALFDTLRDCGHFDAALIAVVGDHGEAFGEGGAFGHGGALGRAAIEVPLALKLPRPGGRPRQLAVPATERISTTRLFATVLDVVGLPVPPGVAPTLTLRDAAGAESEVYRLNGVNQFSLVEGDLQLVRTVRFAPADPDYAAARRALVDPAFKALLTRSPRAVINQLNRAFRRTPPFRDRSEIHLELRRWTAGGGSAEVEDPAALARLDAALEDAYFRFVAEELTPAEARRR